jgi:hypothetical protein
MRHAVAIGVLCLVVWFLYAPATNRVFAADQIWYFAELDGQRSLQAGLQHYDYAASRRYWKGDDALFRPLLFAWLAAANTALGPRHVAWNIATLAIHMAVVAALYALLISIQPSPFSFLIALLFAVMKPAADLVLWNHLGGYLLAWLCLLIALRAFVLMMQSKDRLPRAHTITFVAAFGAAALLHESMVPVSIVAAMLLVIHARRVRQRLSPLLYSILFAPALVYGTLYVFHLGRVARPAYVDPSGDADSFGASRLLAVIPRTLRTLVDWTMEIALPAALDIRGEAYTRLSVRFEPSMDSASHWFNALLALAAFGILMTCVSRERLRRHAALLIVLATTAVGYAGIIALGRTRSETLAVGYYLYLFSLVTVVIAYAAADLSRLRGVRALASWAVLILLVALHWTETQSVVSRVSAANQPASAYLRNIERFIDAHRHEADFSFATQRASALDPEIELVEGYPDDPGAIVRRMRVTEILFRRYYNRDRPKYVPF